MSVFSRFFGKTDADDSGDGQLVANPKIEHPLSLQVLFPEPFPLDSDRLAEAFRAYHRSMSRVRCEIDPTLSREGKVFGMIGWGRHVVRCVGFDLPMPTEAVEACVAPSHYPQELKQRARSHKAHVILYYAGYELSPLEQYVALAATAGVLARLGAIVVLNESGHTSFPASALSGADADGDIMDLLRTLPLPILYCGFVKHEVEEIPGVWMRTYGAPLLGLPDLAAHAAGHHEGQHYFDMFDNMFRYLMESGAQLAAGHTMQIGDKEYLRFRGPADDEGFLMSGGEVLVGEVIGPDEINRLNP
ncbi:MAG TPA: DUF4261 domain-containing protein [Clostridia bacterium]|nr:DUF4261 domain-containing protein [Clostridia bacterium]